MGKALPEGKVSFFFSLFHEIKPTCRSKGANIMILDMEAGTVPRRIID